MNKMKIFKVSKKAKSSSIMIYIPGIILLLCGLLLFKALIDAEGIMLLLWLVPLIGILDIIYATLCSISISKIHLYIYEDKICGTRTNSFFGVTKFEYMYDQIESVANCGGDALSIKIIGENTPWLLQIEDVSIATDIINEKIKGAKTNE